MSKDNPIILFDGVCNFCNYWVQFALRHNKKKNLRFTSLQGEAALKLLPRYHIDPVAISSVILIENEKAYTQSSAALHICRHLNGGWKLFYGLIIIPKFMRDFIYNIIARNRYRWFGKRDACMIPDKTVSHRFLD